MTDATRRFETPTIQTEPLGTASITGVWLADDEEIDWHYAASNGRYFVTGYTIRKKAEWWKLFNSVANPHP